MAQMDGEQQGGKVHPHEKARPARVQEDGGAAGPPPSVPASPCREPAALSASSPTWDVATNQKKIKEERLSGIS